MPAWKAAGSVFAATLTKARPPATIQSTFVFFLMQILKQWLGKSCCWISRQRDERVFFKHEQHWKTGECRSFGQWSDNWAEKPPTAFMKHREEMVGGASLSCFNPEQKSGGFWDSGWAPQIESTGKVPSQGVPSLNISPTLTYLELMHCMLVWNWRTSFGWNGGRCFCPAFALNRSMQLSFFANIHLSSFNSCCWFLSMFCLLSPRKLADKLDTFGEFSAAWNDLGIIWRIFFRVASSSWPSVWFVVNFLPLHRGATSDIPW